MKDSWQHNDKLATRRATRTCHLIFVYNSCISWLKCIISAPLETGMNTLQTTYKILNNNCIHTTYGSNCPAPKPRLALNCDMKHWVTLSFGLTKWINQPNGLSETRLKIKCNVFLFAEVLRKITKITNLLKKRFKVRHRRFVYILQVMTSYRENNDDDDQLK